MSWVVARRVCALVVVCALAVGPASLSVLSSARCVCPPDCPMHAHGLTCHHHSGLRCHQAHTGAGIYGGCDRGADQGIPVVGLRAILAVFEAGRPFETQSAFTVASAVMTTRPLPEPPPHPPRLHLA